MFLTTKRFLQPPLSNPTSLVTSSKLQVWHFSSLLALCFIGSLKLCAFSDLLKWGCWILEVLDRFSRCNSTVEYSGKKIAWRGDSWQSGRRRVRPESCDVFSGKWVFDNVSHPLYNESDCPYMSDQLACHKHGRSDLGYQYWRWQPHNCNLKRWFSLWALCLWFLAESPWSNYCFGLGACLVEISKKGKAKNKSVSP